MNKFENFVKKEGPTYYFKLGVDLKKLKIDTRTDTELFVAKRELATRILKLDIVQHQIHKERFEFLKKLKRIKQWTLGISDRGSLVNLGCKIQETIEEVRNEHT